MEWCTSCGEYVIDCGGICSSCGGIIYYPTDEDDSWLSSDEDDE